MSTINELNSASNVSGSDLLAIWSPSASASRKLSLSDFLAWLNDQEVTVQDGKITQYAAPLTGQTLQVTDSGNSVWLILTPSGTLASLTLKMPLVSAVSDRTELLCNTTQTLTSLTFDGNGATLVGAPTTLSANGFFRLRYDIVLKTWYRV